MRENVGERLRNEPAVRRFAFTTRLPGLLGQSIPSTVLEVAGREDGDRGWRVQTATSELEMFEVIGGSMVAGRPFTSADYAPDQRVAVVNQTFVDEVVGPAAAEPRIYYPLSDGGVYPLRMFIEVAGDPADFAPRLRAIVAEAESGLILDEVLPLDDLQRSEMLGELFFVVLLGFVAVVTALLATAGVSRSAPGRSGSARLWAPLPSGSSGVSSPGPSSSSVSASSSASPPSACWAPGAWAWREAAAFGWREPGSPRSS